MTTIDPTGQAAASTVPSPRAEQFGKDTFLKLLVAQLRYQDPMSPADGTEFVAQTAQFTMVERLEELAKQNAALVDSQRLLAGSTLLGRRVTYLGEDGAERTATVTAARLGADGPVLAVGDDEIPMAAVRSIAAAPTTS